MPFLIYFRGGPRDGQTWPVGEDGDRENGIEMLDEQGTDTVRYEATSQTIFPNHAQQVDFEFVGPAQRHD